MEGSHSQEKRITRESKGRGVGGPHVCVVFHMLVCVCLTAVVLLTCVCVPQLPGEEQEVYEEASHCASLLVQLYGGDGPAGLTPATLRSLTLSLQRRVQPRQLRLLLRLLKRLVGERSGRDFFPLFCLISFSPILFLSVSAVRSSGILCVCVFE